MKISEQEVSRLLFSSPFDRTGTTSSNITLEGQAPQNQRTIREEISPDSPEVQRIARLVDQLPDVREERVQALKAQIENGSYNISGEDIADLIIRRLLADNTAI